MSKILLTNLNSVWGVIKNPNSSDVYRHVLSFDNQALKDAFITKYLTKGNDYKLELENQPEIGLTEITSSDAKFRVNIKDYPNETINSLLNKDFAIVKEVDQIRFYTLSSKRINANIIQYDAELDIFFTYDIKDMFNDKPLRIKRGMLDRFYKDVHDGNKIKPIINKSLYVVEANPFYNFEDIDRSSEDALIPFEDEILDYDDNIFSKASSVSDSEFAIAKQVFKNMRIEYLETKYFNDKPSIVNNVEIDYTCMLGKSSDYVYRTEEIFGVEVETKYGVKLNVETPESNNHYDILKISDSIKNSAKTLKNSYTILQINPLRNMISRKGNSKIYISKINNFPNHGDDGFKFTFSTDERFSTLEISGNGNYTGYLHASNYNLRRIKSKPDYRTKNIKKIPDKLFAYVPNHSFKNDLSFEVKSYLWPYRNIVITDSTKSAKELKPQYLHDNEISVKLAPVFNGVNNGYYAFVMGYKNKKGNEILSPNFEEQLESFNTYGLPINTSAWDEFIARNKNQQNARFLSTGLGVGLGALGLLASPLTGGASIGVGLGAISLATKSAMDINNQLAQRKDVRSTPDKVNGQGNQLLNDILVKDLSPHLTEKRLAPLDMKLVQQHFYKYGYNLNNQLFNINEFIKNRYYFNYVEAPEVFENFKMQLSSDIKQLVDESFANGITIWNVRDLDTFKGVKNYDYDNVEMSLLV